MASIKSLKYPFKDHFIFFYSVINNLVYRITDFFTGRYKLTDSLEKFEEARLLSISCFTTSLFVLGYCPIYIYLIPYPEGVVTLSIGSIFFLAIPFLLRTGFPLFIIQNIFIGIGYLTILSLSAFSGGIYSAITPWLVLVPLEGQLLLKKNNARFWIILVALTIIAFCLLNFNGFLTNYAGQSQLKTWWYMLSYSGLALIGMALNNVFKSIKHHSEVILQQRNEELKKVNYELDNFVYSVSHDLRGPIASVLGLINLTETTSQEEDSITNLSMMRNSLNKLDQTIKDINDFSRNERMEFQPETIQFKKEISDVIEDLHYLIEDTNINIQTDIQGDYPFYSDAFRLSIVLKNLISNAIKFRNPYQENPYIHITIKTHPEKCIIKISDNGIGIRIDQQDKIFNMFYRASTPSNGSGLGLYILSQTLTKLNGSISVSSEIEKGSTFTVEIPNITKGIAGQGLDYKGGIMKKTRLSASEIENLIMVSSPYNIIEEVHDDHSGNFTATVQNEYLYKDEGGPLGAAEFGRHIAILGSIQLAKAYNFGEPYFYLATNAQLKRITREIFQAEKFHLKTRILYTEKRKGKIYGQISDDDGKILYDGTFEYIVLNPKIFEKQYKHFRTDGMVKNKVSPYIQRRFLTSVNVTGNEATADFGTIQMSECEGHFTHYPSLAIAVVGNLISELGIRLFQEYMEKKFDKIVVKNASVNSFRLAFHGEDVKLNAYIKEKLSDSRLLIYCEAMVNGEIFSDAEIELEGIQTVEKEEINGTEQKGNILEEKQENRKIPQTYSRVN